VQVQERNRGKEAMEMDAMSTSANGHLFSSNLVRRNSYPVWDHPKWQNTMREGVVGSEGSHINAMDQHFDCFEYIVVVSLHHS